MQATTVKLHSLGYDQAKTYWIAALFVAGNVLLPQLCHLVPQGGVRWLPIYFFTLIAAYKYGWRAGMLTAVASPLINSALFGMPAADTLPPILFKSSLLAVAAGLTAARCRRVSLPLLAAVVLGYQAIGHSRRMGDDRIASRSLAGFPYRTAGHVAPDPRRLGLHALDAPPISRERLSGDPDSSDEYDLTAIQGGCTP